MITLHYPCYKSYTHVSPRRCSTHTSASKNPPPQQPQQPPLRTTRSLLGKHAQATCSDFHVVRRDSRGNTVTAPRLVSNLESHNTFVHEHQLLEDDWRCFRALLHNRQKALQLRLTPEQNARNAVRNSKLAWHVLGLAPDKDYIANAVDLFGDPVVPEVETYKMAVGQPAGYMYRKHAKEKADRLAEVREEEKERVLATRYMEDVNIETHLEHRRLAVPVTDLDFPFAKFHVPEEFRDESLRSRKERSFDVDPILVEGGPDRLHVYNEADAVPDKVACEQLNKPLTGRLGPHSVKVKVSKRRGTGFSRSNSTV